MEELRTLLAVFGIVFGVALVALIVIALVVLRGRGRRRGVLGGELPSSPSERMNAE